MIFLPGGKKKKNINPMNSGVFKLAAILFIIYIIVMDYENRGSPPLKLGRESAEQEPAEKKPLPGSEEIYEDMKRPDSVAKPEIKQDPKLQIETLLEGRQDGPQAGYGDTVTVKYTGILEDKTLFVDTREVPDTFVLGDGSVIPGLEQGIAGMRESEVRQVLVPAELGYHPPFSNPKVPEGANLGFLVKMVDIQEGKGAQVERLSFMALDEVTGQGEPVKAGDRITTQYAIYNAHGMLLAKSEEPHGFVLGESKAPQDYAEGITGMKPGGKRLIIVPPSVLRDLETELPNYELLHIEVELLKDSEVGIQDSEMKP